MGFLDHSTNNIIVDAVLTDIGRQALARQDGSFSIFQFALGDDEIDYDIINQYGKTVGKEKIEKNTPVFEALTNNHIALKYKLKSLPNAFLTHMPVYEIRTKDRLTTLDFDLNSDSQVKTLAVSITTNALSNVILPGIRDDHLLIEVDNLFLVLTNGSLEKRSSENIATYRLETSNNNINPTANLSLGTQFLDSNTFDVYSTTSGFIRTFIKITGARSGTSKVFEVRIKKSS